MIVVDTDVVSYIFKRHPSAQAFVELLEGHPLYISFMTVAEIEHGMATARWGERLRYRMRRYLSGYEVCESSPMLCRIWAAVMEESASKGRRMSHEDAWIAATAVSLNLPLATNNWKDFLHLEQIRLLAPAG